MKWAGGLRIDRRCKNTRGGNQHSVGTTGTGSLALGLALDSDGITEPARRLSPDARRQNCPCEQALRE